MTRARWGLVLGMGVLLGTLVAVAFPVMAVRAATTQAEIDAAIAAHEAPL